ncbi:MAG: hypothetical protein U9P72_02255 [Campylobacterota bacterium]|nr:hypothetical protein [Campylobacterota bacterium]
MKRLKYMFTREGLIQALDLSSLESLNYHIRKAKKLGVKTSKNIGGVELFDIDCLEYPENHIFDGRNGEQLFFEFKTKKQNKR